MKCCFITVAILSLALGLTLFFLLSKKDDDLSNFEELEEITVQSIDDCQFDKKMNNSLWSLHRKNEKSYYKAIGINPVMMMVLGGLTADIQFTLNGDDLIISTISPLKTVKQRLKFDESVTMKAGNNPLISGPEIAKITRRKKNCGWKGTFSHPDHVKNEEVLTEYCTWRLIKNDTMLEIKREANWDLEAGGRWIFKR